MASRIPSFYRIFFLYIDPLICLSGIYIYFFAHPLFITSGAPQALTAPLLSTTSFSSSPATPVISPLVRYLLFALGGHGIFIFCIQLLLLHKFKTNLKIWEIVQFGILLVDLTLLFAMWDADREGFWRVGQWGTGEWSNFGILGSVIVIRSAFLGGIGF